MQTRQSFQSYQIIGPLVSFRTRCCQMSATGVKRDPEAPDQRVYASALIKREQNVQLCRYRLNVKQEPTTKFNLLVWLKCTIKTCTSVEDGYEIILVMVKMTSAVRF